MVLQKYFVSNENWAKYLCLDSACYVNRNCSKSIVKSIKEIINNNNYKNKIISSGSRILKVSSAKDRLLVN